MKTKAERQFWQLPSKYQVWVRMERSQRPLYGYWAAIRSEGPPKRSWEAHGDTPHQAAAEALREFHKWRKEHPDA